MHAPLVCVNGVVPPDLTFAALVAELGPDQPVLLHDLVGYADDLPPDYTLSTELVAVADRLPAGRPAHLLGYSAGASVALAFATSAPDRIATLTLIEPPWVGIPPDTGFEARLDEIMLHTPADLRWEVFHRLLTRPGVVVPSPPRAPPAWAQHRVRRGADVWRALRSSALDPARVRAFDRPVYLPVATDSHPFFADTAHRLAALLPDATIETYRGNHVHPPHVADVARFAAALRRLFAGGMGR